MVADAISRLSIESLAHAEEGKQELLKAIHRLANLGVHRLDSKDGSVMAEAVTLKEVKKENVGNFIQVNILYHFGIPQYIIIDNAKSFDNKLMNNISDLFGFKQRKYSMYPAAINGLAEIFNKTLCNLLKKVVSKSKQDCHERMEEAVWAYRMTYRTPTQATPYTFAFGVEAVLLLVCQIPSLRLDIQEGLSDEKNAKLHLAESS
ncbi:uncharacterized protein LOC107841435 [Capsicum annuum]|uniref:uncharacterized protein LOC107841435 n=1 Tax=Capsicum annuum TaxID=4072 RepID=UPI001FB14C92|nr:uncharacterized protein LOC107841435 [Capsicum annuum]